MLTSNEALTREDLIRPLSLEALEYFATEEIPVHASNETPLWCKFIRLGEAVMIGADIHFGEADFSGRKSSVLHRDLFFALREDEVVFEANNAVAMNEPFSTGGRYTGVFNDGGYARIRALEKQPIRLILSGDSLDYGRGDESARQRSVDIAQQLVGNSVAVTARG